MGVEKLAEVDPRISRIAQRSSRRRYTFGRGSPHEWRRDEREAHRGKDTNPIDNHYRGFHKVPSIDGRVLDPHVNPNDAGTNAIYRELGVPQKQIELAFAMYVKYVVKATSRLAVEYARKYGPGSIQKELPYMLEAVYALGADNLREIIFNQGRKPSEIMTNPKMDRYLKSVPPYSTLEIVAGNVKLK